MRPHSPVKSLHHTADGDQLDMEGFLTTWFSNQKEVLLGDCRSAQLEAKAHSFLCLQGNGILIIKLHVSSARGGDATRQLHRHSPFYTTS